MTKIDTLFLTKMSLKNHTLWGWTYPYSPYKGVRPSLLGQSQRKVSQINTFRSELMCNKLELIYSSFFSTIGSVLYLASTKNPRLWQLSESAWYKAAISTNPLHTETSHAQHFKPQPFSDWTSFRKRNTISFWEIAACCSYFSSRNSYYVIKCVSPWVVQSSDCVGNIYRFYLGLSVLYDPKLDETLPGRR